MANLTLVALSAVSGVPLFIRHRGSTKSPSYNVVGSLNGVFMFGESQGTKLLDTRTPHSSVTWTTFHDSLRLILIHGEDVTHSTSHRKIHRSTSGPHHTCHSGSPPEPSSPLVGGPSDRRLLDLVFDSLVLLLSLDALTDITNVERLKKDLKVCYPLLDALLERCEGGGGGLFSHLVHCADTVLPADNYNLQAEVGRWSESQCSSSYGCLLSSSGRVLAATRHYWSLSPSELVLLPLLLLAAPAPSTARDIPVYLPNKSPKVPLRLVGMRLTGQVWAVAVCGPAPSLACAVRAASTFWPPYYAGLETLAATQPYNLTAAARQALDKAVLGLLLVNYETKRCVSCVHLGPTNKASLSGLGTDKNTQLSRAGASTPAPPPSNTSTIKSSRAAPLTANNINVAMTNPLRNNNNNGDTRSRKTAASASSSKGMQLHSPPPSQTNTLKSSSSSKAGAPTIHTYQTVKLNISPVQPRRALSPRSNGSRALSPSSGSRALSPSKGSRALSPSSGSRILSPSRSRALSPIKGSRALSPGGSSKDPSSAGGGDGSRALSPSSRPSSQLSRALSPGPAKAMSPKSSAARRVSSPSGRANPSSSRSQRALSPTASSHRSGSPNTSTMRSGKSLSGGHCPSAASPMTPNFKMAALASVYRGLVGGLLQPPGLPSVDSPPVNIEAGHVVSEAYVWCGSCRVYALQTASLHLLVLLPSALPHALARRVRGEA